MKYYIVTIEQYSNEGAYTEIGKIEKQNTYDGALGRFYDLLSIVAKSAAHNFLDIKIIQSNGGIVKKDVYGEYVEYVPPVTPTGE